MSEHKIITRAMAEFPAAAGTIRNEEDVQAWTVYYETGRFLSLGRVPYDVPRFLARRAKP